MAKKTNVECYVVGTDGVPTKLDPKTMETESGLYKTPRHSEILELPPSLTFSKRRIAVFPIKSPTPYPLASEAVHIDEKTMGPKGVRAYTSGDTKRLEGGFWPAMLARALGLAEKIHVKDIIVFVLLGINLLLSGAGLYLTYKLLKFAGAL